MNAPEPLLFAIAHHAIRDVETKLATWRDALAARCAVLAAEFGRRLSRADVPYGVNFADWAEGKADTVIEGWCRHRQVWINEITRAVQPDTIVVVQSVGMAGQLGEVIGLQLDNSLRDLDCQLRETIAEAKRRR